MKLVLEFETTEELKQLLLVLCQQNNIKVEPDRNAVNKIKDKIKERDENSCVLCKSDENLVVHHIFNFKEYPDLRTEESNLVTLCRRHHKRLHSEFGNNVTLNEFEKFIGNYYEYRWLLLNKLDEYNIDFIEDFNDVNPVMPFINDCCVIDPDIKIPASALYLAYTKYKRFTGGQPMNQRNFSLELERANERFKLGVEKKKISKVHYNIWVTESAHFAYNLDVDPNYRWGDK